MMPGKSSSKLCIKNTKQYETKLQSHTSIGNCPAVDTELMEQPQFLYTFRTRDALPQKIPTQKKTLMLLMKFVQVYSLKIQTMVDLIKSVFDTLC